MAGKKKARGRRLKPCRVSKLPAVSFRLARRKNIDRGLLDSVGEPPARRRRVSEDGVDTSEVLSGSLQSIADRFTQSVSEDFDEDDSPASHTDDPRSSLELGDILDYGRPFWKNYTPAQSSRGLDEEREAYEMLDLDADGEDDANDLFFDIDAAVEDLI